MPVALSKLRVMACLLGLAAGFHLVPTRADAVSDGVARATAVIDKYRQLPAFVPPGAPFDIRAVAKGKTMLSIPNTSANQFLRGIIAGEIATGKAIGLKVRQWQNEGQPSQWVQGINYAISNKFSIIDLIAGINPAVVEPQLRAARAAGLQVFASHFYDPSQPPDKLLSGSLAVSFYRAGWILGNWMIYKTNGHANAIIVKTAEVLPTGPLVKGIHDALAANCPDCKVAAEINVGITEWGTKIQPSVQSALLAHPRVNYVIPIYDSMSQFVVPAIRLSGRTGTVSIATFNGTPFVLDFIRNGDVQMDIGESLDWIARSTVDGYMRKLAGLPMPKEINVPFYLFDASNIRSAGVPAELDEGYGTGYVADFQKVWEIK